MSISLSPRLMACCSFVNSGDRIADIGCDHGYLGIHLLQTGKASFVYASDINEGPLKSAVQNADKYGVSKTTIAFAWILRHPAKMQPVTGTTNLERLADCLKAADVLLTREEWYEIYRAAGNVLP